MSNKTATGKRGRKTILEVLLAHYGTKKALFPVLHEIAQKAVKENDGQMNFPVIHAAIVKQTGLNFGINTFRNMLRNEPKSNVPPKSILGQAIRLGPGAPKGSCEGMVRNPYGRGGK